MKLSYRQKISLYFIIIFAVFTLGIVIFEKSQDKKFRTEALEEKLDIYAEIINSSLIINHNNFEVIDSLTKIFPQHIRITIIDKQGTVLYDNSLEKISNLENHAGRPEISKAEKQSKGKDIRLSASNHHEYLYYAKRFNTYFIRVALPYDIQVKNFLKSDNLFLYYITALFIIILFFINYVAGRFGQSIKRLNEFAQTVGNDNSKSPIDFPEDELGMLGSKIYDDYKRLKSSKKEIEAEREKLLQHVYTSGEGICFFSSDKKVEFHNGLFIQYLNIITEESASDPLIIYDDPAFAAVSSFLSKEVRESNYFATQINKQGKSFYIQVNIFENKSFEMIINDITKQEKTRLLKQEMTGNIAHELRTPVTSIRGYLEIILSQSPDSEKTRTFLEKTYNQTLILSELIQDMSLITKIEGAPQSFQLEPIHLINLLEDLQADFNILFKENNISMHWNINNDVIIKGNHSLLYSVFRNLTDNVIRYAGKNTHINIHKYNEDKGFYYFSYSDTGTGIPDERHLNRLFERFYRVNEGRTRDTGGSGLGLSIVKNAILFHKGTIVAKNKTGGGLEFLFKLPRYTT